MSSQAQKHKTNHIIEFDKIFQELVCDDVPMSPEDTSICDPWDGKKPHADGGFVEKYCISRQPFQLKDEYWSDYMTLDKLLSSYEEHKIDQEYKAKFKDAEDILQIKIKKDDFLSFIPDEEELNKIFLLSSLKE